VFVALALKKKVYCDLDLDQLKQLVPVQNVMAAKNIAEVCRGLLGELAPEPPSGSGLSSSNARLMPHVAL
jgi:hypothetical protein